MTPLGPYGAPPRLGLAVSGGGDSLALALLAAEWARAQGGSVLAFIVDHGLRTAAAAAAAAAAETLARLDIPARVLTLDDLRTGASLPARARAARLAALEAACRDAGIIDLLLGHHAADQAETIIMRRLRGSGPAGLAGMAALSETASVRLLRPLLGVAPAQLRAVLMERGLGWAEDPTNADGRFTRARLRTARADAGGAGPATRAFARAASADGLARDVAERSIADWLATTATIRPEGFALLPDAVWPSPALAALLRMVTGDSYVPAAEAVDAIGAAPARAIGRGICLGGALLRPAGRLGPGFLICREPAAVAAAVSAKAGVVWDGRFRRPEIEPDLPGETIGPLGSDARSFRHISDLPAVVLETLPAYRGGCGDIMAVPALNWPDLHSVAGRRLLSHPRHPASGGAFFALSCRIDKAVMPAAAAGHEDRDALPRKTSYL
jgi:tRNA(Ile)-lysidine synthase